MTTKTYQNVFRDSVPSRQSTWAIVESLVGLAKIIRKILRFIGLCAQTITRPLQRRSQPDDLQSGVFVQGDRTSSLSKILSSTVAITHYCIKSIPGIGRLIPVSWWSKWIEKYICRSRVDWRVLLDHALVDLSILRPSRNHTHGNSASYRTSINIALKRLVESQGFVPYQVSGAKSDHGDSDGCRYFYGIKDLKIHYKNDKVGERHVLLMTDVDYHLNINEYMRLGQPIMMYTLCPKQPGKVTDEYAFYFLDDEIHYDVSGGAKYVHQLWDYNGDTVSVIDQAGAMIVFDVCQKEIEGDQDHRIIGLYPAAKVPFPFWLNFDVEEGFKRKKVTYNGYNIIRHSDLVSMSLNGSTSSYTLSEAVYIAVRKRFERAKTPLNIGDIERHLNNTGIPNAPLAAAQVIECIERLSAEGLLNIPKSPLTTAIQTCYQTLHPLVNEDGKPCAVMLTSPLVTNPAVFPTKSFNNDVATITGRVDRVRNGQWPQKWYENAAREFINLLVPERIAGNGAPLGTAAVNERQNRPMQQARTRLAQNQLSVKTHNVLKAFTKAEGYSNFTDPRNITTMSASLTIMLSGFTYAFKDNVLKHLWWYAPGKTPSEMIDQLSIICRNGCIVSDFSRLDGSVSMFLQLKVVYAAYMKWFGDDYKVEFKNHFDSVFKNSAVTAHGYRYQPGYGTRSGSPLTTDGNTMILAYVCFCALLKTGLTSESAWNGLGLYCGDDAVNSAHPRFEETFKLVCRDIGLTVEVETLKVGSPVPFLGRVFWDPVTCRDSIQDPRRTLPKLHLAPKRETFGIEQMAYNKAAGYFATDKYTPVIGTWARKVMVITGFSEVDALSTEDAWRISNAWPQEREENCRELFKHCMQLDEDELTRWEQLINDADNLAAFPTIWDNERQAKIDCVFNGELIRCSATLRIIHKPKKEALLECQKEKTINNNVEQMQSRSRSPTTSGERTLPNQHLRRSSQTTTRRPSTTRRRAPTRTPRPGR